MDHILIRGWLKFRSLPTVKTSVSDCIGLTSLPVLQSAKASRNPILAAAKNAAAPVPSERAKDSTPRCSKSVSRCHTEGHDQIILRPTEKGS